MYIRHVDVNTKDIFLGNKGWDNWTRFSCVNGEWKQSAGLKVDERVARLIVERITTWNDNHKPQHRRITK